MKLVLCSEGFYTENTVQACVELCGKPQHEIAVAVINEGFAVEPGDKRWVLNNLNDVAKNFPAEMDIINLLALPIDEIVARIEAKDVIFVIGGNTDYLMKVFNDSGLAPRLPDLLERKVYVGSSAGSMIIGHRVSTEAYLKVYGEAQDFGVTEYLNFVDFALKPHLGSKDFPNNRPEILDQYASATDFPVYALHDDSAVIIDGETMKFIGSEPYRVGQ